MRFCKSLVRSFTLSTTTFIFLLLQFLFRVCVVGEKLAYRFVTIPLAPSSVLCVICGAGPSFHELRAMAQNVFITENQLQNVERCMTRNLPEHFELDQCVLAIIVANVNVKKSVFARNLNQATGGKRPIGSGHLRLDLLKKIFDQTLQYNQVLNNGDNKEMQLRSRYMEPLNQYWCLEYHKCYAHYDQIGNTIFILFMSSVPTPAMRFIAQKLLYSILQDKTIGW